MAELFAFTYEEKKQMAARTAQLLKEEIGLKGDAIQAVYLIPEIDEGHMTEPHPAAVSEESRH